MASPSLTHGVPERGVIATSTRAPPSGSPTILQRRKPIGSGGGGGDNVVAVAGRASGSAHAYEREEALGIAAFLGQHAAELAGARGGGPTLPLAAGSGPEALFAACADGLLLCRLVNLAAPGTIDERALNVPADSLFRRIENAQLALTSARAIGASVVNVHAADIVGCAAGGREHLVLGVLWQLVRASLLARVSLAAHPELAALGEDTARLAPEEVLLRWINYHVKPPHGVANLHHDLRSGAALCRLLSAIAGTHPRADAARGAAARGLALGDVEHEARAAAALAAARFLGVEPILSAADVAGGHRRLLLAFVATLFNALPALPPPQAPESHTEVEVAECLELNGYRAWLRSLDLGAAAPEEAAAAPPSPLLLQSPRLLSDVASGAVLLRALEAVAPGATTADDRRRADEALAATGPKSRFVHVAACNSFAAAARRLGLSLGSTAGVDVNEERASLVLGAAWQLRRRHLVGLLQRPGERAVTDADVLAWANSFAPSALAARDFKQASPSFLLRVLAGAFPGAVDMGLATGDELEDARLAVSLARKSGAVVFGVAEELASRNARATFAFLAAAMHRAMQRAEEQRGAEEAAAAAAAPAALAPPPLLPRTRPLPALVSSPPPPPLAELIAPAAVPAQPAATAAGAEAAGAGSSISALAARYLKAASAATK